MINRIKIGLYSFHSDLILILSAKEGVHVDAESSMWFANVRYYAIFRSETRCIWNEEFAAGDLKYLHEL